MFVRLQRLFGGTTSPSCWSLWIRYSLYCVRRTARYHFCMSTIMPRCFQSGGLASNGSPVASVCAGFVIVGSIAFLIFELNNVATHIR